MGGEDLVGEYVIFPDGRLEERVALSGQGLRQNDKEGKR